MRQVSEDIYYVGVNDRRTHDFENQIPIPYGISYNSYVIKDDKTALVDTVELPFSERFFANLAEVLDGKDLDYLIVNHMEPDHSGCIGLLRKYYPNVKIVGNRLTIGMLEGYFGISDGIVEVTDGGTLSLGRHNLSFHTAPMVHWPEVMFTYDGESKTLFSADAFGTFGALNGGLFDEDLDFNFFREEMIRYYSNIVGKYGPQVQTAFAKLRDIKLETVCPAHGPVWRRHLGDVYKIYDRLSRFEGDSGVSIIYGSMYGYTEEMAEIIASSISDAGVHEISMHDVSRCSDSVIMKDVFKYKAVIIGSPTYCGSLYPNIAKILYKLKLTGVKNRLFGCFGEYSWAGAAVRKLKAFGEEMSWESIGDPVERKQGADVAAPCRTLGILTADKLLGK
ncbi:MAG: FprA family A-type flavoprotein [Bacteroidales bacterium]|jgi:flavorubredoxin|nr:FprA family A-type flavoprotein [Bacteroidales bacterium]